MVLLSARKFPDNDRIKQFMHPLETLQRWRSHWFGWLPFKKRWERAPKDVAPTQDDDWLLEPINQQEATALFPHLSEERAIVQYQKMRLQIRQRADRGF